MAKRPTLLASVPHPFLVRNGCGCAPGRLDRPPTSSASSYRTHHGRIRGFTLIELIFTIVILGALVAVAVPRYQNMINDARASTVEGAMAALASQVHLDYAQHLANGVCGGAVSCPPMENAVAVTIGDFSGQYTKTEDTADVFIELTGSTSSTTSWFPDGFSGTTSRTITLE